MRKFFHLHLTLIIVTLVVIFLIIIAFLYTWGINDLVLEIHQALTASSTQAVDGFNLPGAASLGLHNPAGTVAPVSTPTPVSPATTTVATSTAPAVTTSTTTTSTATTSKQ